MISIKFVFLFSPLYLSNYRLFPDAPLDVHHLHWGTTPIEAHTLMRVVRKSLSMDSRRWTEMATDEIGACLEKPQDKPPDLKGA